MLKEDIITVSIIIMKSCMLGTLRGFKRTSDYIVCYKTLGSKYLFQT